MESLQLVPGAEKVGEDWAGDLGKVNLFEGLQSVGHSNEFLPGLLPLPHKDHLPQVQTGGLSLTEESRETLPVIDPGILQADRPPKTKQGYFSSLLATILCKAKAKN